MKNNKGLTLIELIITLAIVMLILPVVWNFIQGSLDDSIDINAKVIIQTSVNSLMNQLQKDIQESKKNGIVFLDGDDNKILIVKSQSNVLYEFDEVKAQVEYHMNVDGEGEPVTGYSSTSYENIVGFTVKTSGDNGATVYIRGEMGEDARSGYELSNTYYTRNTI